MRPQSPVVKGSREEEEESKLEREREKKDAQGIAGNREIKSERGEKVPEMLIMQKN